MEIRSKNIWVNENILELHAPTNEVLLLTSPLQITNNTSIETISALLMIQPSFGVDVLLSVIIQLFPEGEVNSGRYIPRREASRYISTALHRP